MNTVLPCERKVFFGWLTDRICIFDRQGIFYGRGKQRASEASEKSGLRLIPADSVRSCRVFAVYDETAPDSFPLAEVARYSALCLTLSDKKSITLRFSCDELTLRSAVTKALSCPID